MAMINEQWADVLDPAVKMFFEMGFGRRPALRPSLFNIQSSTQDKEYTSGIGAIGQDAWDQYEKSGRAGVADFDAYYKTTFEHKEYIMEIPIKRKLIDDAQTTEFRNIVGRVGDSAALKMEKDAASVFNNAESSSFVGGDGVSLINDSHKFSPAKTGATQDNLLTLALTKDNLAEARETMMAFTDDTAELVSATPNLLLVPPELEDTALEITRSVFDPDSANNTINPQNGRFVVAAWHHLTTADRWYLIDSALMMQSLFWFNRVPISVVPKVEDKTVRATWIAYMRYSYGWSDWRWVIGSNPA